VLSPGEVSSVATRGSTPQVDQVNDNEAVDLSDHFIEVDVTQFARHKIRALACHRSQHAISADMFPDSLVERIFGVEYFRQVD
jgi:LmbE family N-acetylglucosaminyl deacetylase